MHVTHEEREDEALFSNAGGTADNLNYSPRNTSQYSGVIFILRADNHIRKGVDKMSNIYRDVTLNQVSENDIGKTLRVAGWVENIRDHGGVSFIDLRDMYAVMQIVIRDGKLLEGIRKEQAVSIEGLIEKER